MIFILVFLLDNFQESFCMEKHFTKKKQKTNDISPSTTQIQLETTIRVIPHSVSHLTHFTISLQDDTFIDI